MSLLTKTKSDFSVLLFSQTVSNDDSVSKKLLCMLHVQTRLQNAHLSLYLGLKCFNIVGRKKFD